MLRKFLEAIRPAVLLIPIAIFLVMIAAGIANGEYFISALKTAFTSLMVNGSWLVSLGVLAFVAFMVFIMVHPVGNIRLGVLLSLSIACGIGLPFHFVPVSARG